MARVGFSSRTAPPIIRLPPGISEVSTELCCVTSSTKWLVITTTQGTDNRYQITVIDRGRVIAFYAVASLTSGGSAFVVLSPEDCRKLRGTSGPNGGIADPMHWMEKKTALRQLVKLMPKSTELAAGFVHDGGVRRDPAPDALERDPDVIDAEAIDEPEVEFDPESGEVLGPLT